MHTNLFPVSTKQKIKIFSRIFGSMVGKHPFRDTKSWIRALRINDKEYAENRYKKHFGRSLDLKDPRTFNEKTQWLKLYYRQPQLIKLADKWLVREFVRERIGEDYLIPIVGIFESLASFEKRLPDLPDRFVIKLTHGSTWNIFVKDKSEVNDRDIAQLERWFEDNYYLHGREWQYLDISPRILCEQMLEPENQSTNLRDYKIFCFNGNPKIIQVDADRFEDHRRCLFDLSWNKLPVQYHFQPIEEEISAPKYLEDMLSAAKALCEGFPFVRVDFYETDHIIFGELTFTPENGFAVFTPRKFDLIFGNMLSLPDQM